MDDKPQVSVIVIFLNAEQFIEEAIASVFTQTYDAWELLLVDDGSSDHSTTIACHYAEQHPQKVRYLDHDHHQNLGMSASRNLGISASRGEFIAFLDADDVWFPNKLEEQVAILAAHPEAGIVYGLDQYWYSWTGNPNDYERDFVLKLGVQPNTLIRPPVLLVHFLRDTAAMPCPTNILVRRILIEDVGGFEDEFRDLYEDQAFYAKAFLKAVAFASDTCWNRYRQHPNTSTAIAQRTGQEREARHFFLTWLERYLHEQGVKDRKVWWALRMELLPYRHPIMQFLLERIVHRGGQMKTLLISLKWWILPGPVQSWLYGWQKRTLQPPVGWVCFGHLRRVIPISRQFGFDRGQPIDRYYIEKFLSCHADDIHGCVLEVGDDSYTRQFGGSRVTHSDVLHVTAGNPKATIIGDLSQADHIPSDTFDCIILTQTLQFIYDVKLVIQTLHRILKPGGVLLTTFPGISQLSDEEWNKTWYWGFTTQSARRLFTEVFAESKVSIESHGNVLAAISFLHGLVAQELQQEELDYCDPQYELLITLRAVKSEVL